MLSLLYSTVLLYYICFCFVLSCTLLIGGNKEILLLLLLSVHCCLVVTCWKRADLLALVGYVYCIFVTFPCGILGQVW